MSNTTFTPKSLALIAHIPVFGIIYSILQFKDQKDAYLGFYVRQMLGITLMGAISSMVHINIFGGFTNNLLWLFTVVFWFISLYGAVNQEKKLVPVIGQYFQDWFKNL